eukprot:evm.model.scf_2321.2 EVM.evm.TU.scf_2321.2   scf_2321:18238-20607(-)
MAMFASVAADPAAKAHPDCLCSPRARHLLLGTGPGICRLPRPQLDRRKAGWGVVARSAGQNGGRQAVQDAKIQWTGGEEGRKWWEEDGRAWVDVSTADEFYAAVRTTEKDLVVVDWFATWCHGCRQSAAALLALAIDPDMTARCKFVRACADGLRGTARAEGARALPHLSIYSADGKRLVGFSAAYTKRKTWRPNIRTILQNKNRAFTVDANGLVVAMDRAKAKAREAEKRAELERLAKFSAEMSTRLDQGTGSLGSWKAASGSDGVPMTAEKEEFLRRHGHEYGYDGQIDAMYASEVGCRMGPEETYMDYTGSSVYCQSQIDAAFEELKTNLFGNPHSANPSSSLTQAKIEEVRESVLRFFNADPKEYGLVFTKSATAAIKMVGETFPWSKKSIFRYLRENHNSVLGVRSYALDHGATFQSMDEAGIAGWVDGDMVPDTNGSGSDVEKCTYNLFAFPAEDNFAGVKYPLEWVREVKSKSRPGVTWKVLLDAAAYVPTQPLDLSAVPADFTAISFYKMFGFPTGLGALIVHNDAVDILRKVFWGGGSVALATSRDNFHILKCRPSDRLEDGTVAFLDIVLLKHGFNMLDRLGGIAKIQPHVMCLTEWLYERLQALKHSNGQPLVRVFGKHDNPDHRDVQGCILNFEVLKPNGEAFSYKTFEVEAAKACFHIRTGVECNPGAAYNYIGIEDNEIEELAGEKQGCDDDVEFLRVQRPAQPHATVGSVDVFESLQDSDVILGHPAEIAMKWVQVPLGSVRVSLGYLSRFEDCARLAKFLEQYKDREDDGNMQ